MTAAPQSTPDISDRARFLAHHLGYEASQVGPPDLGDKVREAAALLHLQDAELSYLRVRLQIAEGGAR